MPASSPTPDPAEKKVVPATDAVIDGAEQTPRAGGNGPGALVTTLVVVIAALALALALTAMTAMRGNSAAKETVTVTVTGSGAAAQNAQPQNQQQARPTPEATVPADKAKARLGVIRHQAGDPMAYGKDDAPVTLVEFADLRCPFCAVFSNTIRPELEQYVKEGTLRYEYRDLPLFGDESVSAAVAARAAGEQGRYHDYLVALYKAAPPEGGHPAMPKEKLLGFAKEAGVPDMARFEKDMASPELKKKVLADQTFGTQQGISGTPFFVINTQVLSGAQPAEVFKAFVEHEAKNTKKQ